MSDISIRLDGLLFGLVIAAVGLVLALMTLSLAARIYWGRGASPQSRRIARACALGLLGCLISFGLLACYIEMGPSPIGGPDWLDWVALPWGVAMLGGLVQLSRPAR